MIRNQNNLLARLQVYPWLCILSYIIHFETQNTGLIQLRDSILIFFVYSIAAVLIWLLAFLFFKSHTKAVLFSFLLLATEFYSPPIQEFLRDQRQLSFLARYIFFLPILFILLGISLVKIRKGKPLSGKYVLYFNLLFLVFITIDLVPLISRHSSAPQTTIKTERFPDADTLKNTPNIYLLLADEYAGDEQLLQQFNFNNSGFKQQLQTRGFYNIPYTRSNYNYTPYSMASIFQMDYLTGITAQSNNQNNLNIAFSAINDNKLASYLKLKGYQVINGSLFRFTNLAPVSAENEFYSTGAKLLLSKTLSNKIKKELWYHLLTTFDLSYFQQDYLKRLASNISASRQAVLKEYDNRPRFIYAHFIMPHYPYLFNSKGEPNSYKQAMDAGNKNNYLGFLTYSNQFFIDLIDSVSRKDPAAIIILMGDHGFTKYNDKNLLKYNFSNIVSIKLPGDDYGNIPDSLSNVNLFRVVLNKQFGIGLSSLPHREITLFEE